MNHEDLLKKRTFKTKKMEKKKIELKNSTKTPLSGSVSFIIAVFVVLLLLNKCNSYWNEHKAEKAQKSDDAAMQISTGPSITKKMKPGESVLFNFNQEIKNRTVGFQGTERKKGVTLYFTYYPSGETWTYTDDAPEAPVYRYTDRSVQITSDTEIELTVYLVD